MMKNFLKLKAKTISSIGLFERASYIVTVGCFLFLISCGQTGFQKSKTGAEYKIISGGSSRQVKIGDFVEVDMIMKNGKDSTMEDTWVNHRTRKTVVSEAKSIRDLNEILLLLKDKDSVIVRIPADSLFKGAPQYPPAIAKGSFLTFQMKIQNVVDKDKMQAFLADERSKVEKAENQTLTKYIKDHNLNVTTTADGLNYIINQQGTGSKPLAGDTVVVNYTGKTLDGKIFDTNNETVAKDNKTFNIQRKMQKGYDPIHFAIGLGQVIKGWDEGLQLMNEGTKFTLLVPSSLGYGERGMPGSPIGPNSSLIFEVELLKIIKGKGVPPPRPMPQMQMPMRPANGSNPGSPNSSTNGPSSNPGSKSKPSAPSGSGH